MTGRSTAALLLCAGSGEHFQKGAGLRILADGKEIAHAATLGRVGGDSLVGLAPAR